MTTVRSGVTRPARSAPITVVAAYRRLLRGRTVAARCGTADAVVAGVVVVALIAAAGAADLVQNGPRIRVRERSTLFSAALRALRRVRPASTTSSTASTSAARMAASVM